MKKIGVLPMSDNIEGLILGGVSHNTTADNILNSLLPDTLTAAGTPLLAWALLVFYGTFSRRSVLQPLSLRKSLAELTSARNAQLDVLDVIRVIAILWVMINHTGSEGRIDVLERLPSAHIFKSSIHEHAVFGALMGNSALGVEIFLVLSGLLAAISWFRRMDEPFWSHYFAFLTKRWLRLFPSIAIFIYIAAGPITRILLPRYHTTMISACGFTGIAAHLLFVGNWQETPICMGYLWYLGLDMQLYVVAPFLLHMLCKCPRKAFASALLLSGVSAVIRGLYCTFYNVCNKSDVDIPFIFYPDQDPSTIKHVYAGLWEMYARPYTKCGPFLFGILLGYYIFNNSTNISTMKSKLMFCCSLMVAISTIYGILPEYWNPYQGNTPYNTLYTALFRTIFAAATSFIIAALVLRKERRPQLHMSCLR
uniref:Ubiquitin-like protease family profile domain-containing protein n=1 Tax=Parascaris univalens TaxID=6257 RepID=A0A914ZNL4_PARUN